MQSSRGVVVTAVAAAVAIVAGVLIGVASRSPSPLLSHPPHSLPPRPLSSPCGHCSCYCRGWATPWQSSSLHRHRDHVVSVFFFAAVIAVFAVVAASLPPLRDHGHCASLRR
ncbi:hypothetical protein EDB84DRAFT_1450945 [Lactarius hengduanensis]|nr:hypothetical protein EDB84DRAFT_1450945 [Lactarius hengduanensis]